MLNGLLIGIKELVRIALATLKNFRYYKKKQCSTFCEGN
jgi:hypothetical protein